MDVGEIVEKSFERIMINCSLITQFRHCFPLPRAVHTPWRRNGPSRKAVKIIQSYLEFFNFTTTHLFALFLSEWIALFMVHVLFEIEECVEENRRHFAAL